jgi:hypothetical protein
MKMEMAVAYVEVIFHDLNGSRPTEGSTNISVLNGRVESV